MISGRICPFSGAFVGLLLMGLLVSGELEAQQFVESSSGRLPIFNEYSSQVAIADVDGDGDLDLCFANGRGFFSASLQERVRLLINDGNAFFVDESAARITNLNI